MNINTIKFSGELIRGSVLNEYDDLDHGIEFIEKTDWQLDHKCESCEFIFKYQDKFYLICVVRTGTYYNGYEWYDENFNDLDMVKEFECIEVEHVPVTKYEWRVVDSGS